MYILAGEKRLAEVRRTALEELKARAAQSGDAMDAQRANDMAANCDRFEKKLHDLKLTRQVALQMAPQIRLLQNNDSLLVERIQSTLSNTRDRPGPAPQPGGAQGTDRRDRHDQRAAAQKRRGAQDRHH